VNLAPGTPASWSAINDDNLTGGDGLSTFSVLVGLSAPNFATVSFGLNTLDNTTIPLPQKTRPVPFNFSTTPGLIVLGAISGLNFLAKRYKQRKKDDKGNLEGLPDNNLNT
jgi:hypothetical protein